MSLYMTQLTNPMQAHLHAHTQGIKRIQNYGMRVITSSPQTPSAELREKLQWTTLTDCRELFRGSTVHKCLHNNAARYMCSKFRTNSSLGYSHTRGYNNIHLEKPNIEYYGKSFEFQGAIKWNTHTHTHTYTHIHTYTYTHTHTCTHTHTHTPYQYRFKASWGEPERAANCRFTTLSWHTAGRICPTVATVQAECMLSPHHR